MSLQKTAISVTSIQDEIINGLKAEKKHIPSKFFYDSNGDKLFQDIMNMEEYYLTDSEYEILQKNKEELLYLFSEGTKSFQLIEFGAGDGLKTKVLLKYFQDKSVNFEYLPIDISKNAIDSLTSELKDEIPGLSVHGIVADYFSALRKLNKQGKVKKIILFLGSNVGNFEYPGAVSFYKKIAGYCNPGDQVLSGFDIKKNPHTIQKAYNDSQGITREFNMNLLKRMNKEFDANFNLETFMHYPVYNPESGEAKSYLISKEKQEVIFKSTGDTIVFDKWEPIYTEISKKYDKQNILKLAGDSGFRLIKNFSDTKKYFIDSLWELKTR